MTEKSASLENEWTFGPEVPTGDFFEHRDVRSESDLEWLVNDLIYALAGNDRVLADPVLSDALGGDDVVYAGPGDDFDALHFSDLAPQPACDILPRRRVPHR